jgi:ribosomal protein S18 acetylase RimI-like enzyme
MRRPSPWVAIPVGLAALGGATIGFVVTAASCAPRSCVVPAAAVALAVGLVAAVGVAVVVVLAVRSIAEYRESLDRDILTYVDQPEPAPPISGAEVTTLTAADASHASAIASFLTVLRSRPGDDWPEAARDAIDSLIGPGLVESWIGGADHHLFVATRPDRVVGLAAVKRITTDTAEVTLIAVAPEVAGSGIGTPLLELAMDELRAAGCRGAVVSVPASNRQAIGFFQRRGYEMSPAKGTSPEEIVVLERAL